MGFSRHDYWSGLPFSPPRDLSEPGIKPASLVPPALAGVFFTTEPPGKPQFVYVQTNFLALVSRAAEVDHNKAMPLSSGLGR